MSGVSKNNIKLTNYSKNVYSQFGEDGIIEKIFSIIGTTTRLCVEFGAWDGFHLSNTANLWKNKKWNAVLIEGNKGKYEVLKEKTKDYKVTPILNYVSFKDNDSLDKILKRNNIKEQIDFLSIDVDGNDYFIFKDSIKLNARVVCCEYNPTIPKNKSIIGEPNSFLGCSALALVELAEKNGYKLISMTKANCFFIHKSLYPKFKKYETDFNDLFPDDHIIHLITNFQGDYFFDKKLPYGLRNKFESRLFVGQGYLPERGMSKGYIAISNFIVFIMPKSFIKWLVAFKNKN